MPSAAERERVTQAQQQAAAEADGQLRDALYAAMAAYLARAASTVLEADGPHGNRPPNLGAWPSDQVWHQEIAQRVVPLAQAAWIAAYKRVWPGHEPKAGAAAAYAAGVLARLGDSAFPRYVLGKARSEMADSRARGEGVAALRKRLSVLLHIDSPAKAARDALLAIWLRRKLKTLREQDEQREREITARGQQQGIWRSAADQSAAGESTTAVNDGTWAGAEDYAYFNQVVVLKEWAAIEDHRTRWAHSRADGQTVGLDEPFTVDGEPMMYPGDPSGSAGNVCNCRCSLLIFLGTLGEDEDMGEEDMGDTIADETGLDGQDAADVLTADGAEEFARRRRKKTQAAKARKRGKAKRVKATKGKTAGTSKVGHKKADKGTGSVKKGKTAKVTSAKVAKGKAAKPVKAKTGLGRHVPHHSHPVGKGNHWAAGSEQAAEPVRWHALS